MAGVQAELALRVRLRLGVRLRADQFGGICYVPHRDDFFALSREAFGLIRAVDAEWRETPSDQAAAYAKLANLGICETLDPATPEQSYSGPSFIGAFPEIPTVSEPLVVNCFATAHCPLKCVYCHADDLMQPFRAAESEADLDNVAATASLIPAMVAVVTGGDPLTRPARAARLIERLAPTKALVLDTSGYGDLDTLLPTLVAHRVHVRVSLDTISPDNDKLRPGNAKYGSPKDASSTGARRTIEACLAAGLPVTVQTVVSSRNENPKEWRDLRYWLIENGVRNWVLHVAVKGGSARRIEERYEGKQRGHILPSRNVGVELAKLVHETIRSGLPIDIRCTDTNQTPNSVLLVASNGDLFTEGYAHSGKVRLYEAGTGRPDLVRALWPHIDRFGHARRYLNWNPWLFAGKSIEEICYTLPAPTQPEDTPKLVETESKYAVENSERLRVRLRALGYRSSARVTQRDEYYDTDQKALEGMDFVLRLRIQSDHKPELGFKGPRFYSAGGEYSRVELELPTDDPAEIRRILADRNLEVTWFFEKRRTLFHSSAKRTAVALDEVPEIGHFVEIEGPLDAVEATVRDLSDYLGHMDTRNYAEIFRAFKQSQGVDPGSIRGAEFSSSGTT